MNKTKGRTRALENSSGLGDFGHLESSQSFIEVVNECIRHETIVINWSVVVVEYGGSTSDVHLRSYS